jgi:hypothetical protein
MRFFQNISICVAAMGCLLWVPSSVTAQSVPYKSSGQDAQYTPGDGDYCGVGKGTHMGKHVIDGNVQADGEFFPAPGIFFAGTFEGTQTAIAANGDELTSSLQGEVVLTFTEEGLVTGLWFPEFTITGGTGRFANASGELTGVAINPPFDPFTTDTRPFDWFIDGTINLGRSNKP